MKPELHIETHPRNAERFAGIALQSVLIKRQNSPTLLMLSGGSCLEILPCIKKNILGNWLTVTTLDERFTLNPTDSNFSGLMATKFYSAITSRGCAIIDTRVNKNETLKLFEKRIRNEIISWRKRNLNGKIIAVFGIGADGHTAGILPYPENLKLFKKLFSEKDVSIRAYNMTKKKNPHTKRVTATLWFLKKIVDEGIIFAVGENKRSAIKSIISRNGSLAKTPARIIREMKSATIFTNLMSLRT